MNFVLLNEALESIKILDQYESLIWTDRFNDAGDFEFYTTIDFDLINKLIENDIMYVWCSFSDHLMCVDQYDISTSFDEGSKIAITGESLESILKRRIIWDYIKFDGKLQDFIEKILSDNMVNPVNESRKIPNFIFERSDDPAIDALTVSGEYQGSDLYEVITQLCKDNDLGFKIYLNSNNQFVFKLYFGLDRSYNQTENPYVIFSPDFQNLGSSNYSHSKRNYKNVVAVVEDSKSSDVQSDKPVYLEYNPSQANGIRRIEIVASDRAIPDNPETESGKDKTLEAIGKKTLKQNKLEELFEGQIDTSTLFKYVDDFNLGDIVQVENEYGIGSPSRITEMVMNKDQDTFEMYPTFESIDKEDTNQ